MITMIVGHRGVGKSELMKRLQLYLPDTSLEFIDLDFEIERKINRSLVEFFLENGEAYFRELEKQIFHEIMQRKHHHTYFCLGAGFDLNELPSNVPVLWVRRRTDGDGRIFLNRPRLNPDILPLEEFKKRAIVRDELYRAKATYTYMMPEGPFEMKRLPQALEKQILTGLPTDVGGVLTLLPEYFLSKIAWQSMIERFQGRSILFELRDDLLSKEQMQQALGDLAGEDFLYAFRHDTDPNEVVAWPCRYFDWPLELSGTHNFIDQFFEVIPQEKRIISFHAVHTQANLDQTLQLLAGFSDKVAHLKISPLLDSWIELEKIYRWQQQDPDHRSLLPRSEDGCWTWFRQYMKFKQRINFWRESEGSSLDQPTVFEWLAMASPFKSFAAVIGDPINHSWTPLEQMDFFAKLSAPVFKIEVSRLGWFHSLPFLQELGLQWAAVTSPHKLNAAITAQSSLAAVNTLAWTGAHWLGTSTDEIGFSEAIEGIGLLSPLQANIFVWGGGGTLASMKHSLPRARYFESRSGKERAKDFSDEELSAENTLQVDSTPGEVGPQILIWAAPRSVETQFPPEHWKPKMVIDLNYKEDSPGREYAQLMGANYQSGAVMFAAQAQGQRVFWMNLLKKCAQDQDR